MKTILYVKSTEIEALQIQGQSQQRVRYDLPAGTILNGVILRPDQLEEALNQMAPKPKKVTLILDSSNIIAKKLTLPKMSKAKLQQVVKGEFDGFQTEQTYQFDVNVLTPTSPMTVMGYAAPQDLIDQYIQVCKTCGIQVERIDLVLNGLINYLTKKPEFQGKTFLFNVISGDSMLSLLFEDGSFKLSNRVRLLQVGQGEFLSQELYNRLSSMLQFNTSERSEHAIEHSYYVGLSPEEQSNFSSFVEGILPVTVHGYADKSIDMNAFYPALATFAGKDDINFAINSQRQAEKSNKFKGYTTKAVIFLALLLGVGVHSAFLLVDYSAAALQHDSLEKSVEDEKTLAAMEHYVQLDAQNALLSGEATTMGKLFTMLSSGSKVEKEVLTHVFDGDVIDHFSYDFVSGQVVISGVFPTNGQATEYAKNLRAKGFFVAMDYSGYQMEESEGFFDQDAQWVEGSRWYRFFITTGYGPVTMPEPEPVPEEKEAETDENE